MENANQFTIDEIKEALKEMNIPYKEENTKKYLDLIQSFHYEPLPLTVDLKNIDTVDAMQGVVVRNIDSTIDNGVYVFTILSSGQAGFFVIIPGTVSRAPMIRKVAGDLISLVNGIDFPPLMPFDMVEITGHLLANTFINMIMESCNIPKENRKRFARLYMPKFLANVGMHFTGAAKEDGSPMIYEEIVNIEPMILYRAMMKEAAKDGGSEQKPEDAKTDKEETPAP